MAVLRALDRPDPLVESSAGTPPGAPHFPGTATVPEMAVVNAVLDALPAETWEAILVRFLSVLYQ